ncbi:MAG TPA: hypothetical protein VEX35_01685 [Allosphingosinicella sp.]|nr:hypothetical protein [Allosphingosinicella sp.]
MALKLNCLENLTAIGIGIGACALAPFDAGLTAGAVIGGSGLFARIRENMRKVGLDDKAAIERMQRAILREWDHWQATPEHRDAVAEADAAMTRSLPQVMMTREELAATATKSPDVAYPSAAAREVVDRLAMHDPAFAVPAAEGAEPPLARAFALAVIERALRAAKEDKDYATLLTLDIAIELGRAIAETLQAIDELGAKIDAGFAAVRESLGGEFERISVQALRGAVARFVVFKPDANMSEVVDAVEEFVPQYEELRARVAALEANDNRLKGAQQAAQQALEQGDLDAARRHLAEAADIQVDRLAEPVRQTAATIDELARADLLALDWQSADANWSRASAMLAPFDRAGAEALEAFAARELQLHGERFVRAPSLSAAIRRWRGLVMAAFARGDEAFWAVTQNNLGIALETQAGRVGGEEGLALRGQAVEAYRAALEVYGQAEKPADWAMAQNNLANALQSQGELTGGEAGLALGTQAIEAYRATLTVYTEDAMPSQWAMTQNNLGNALQRQGERMSGEAGPALLVQAVEAYYAALTVYTAAAEPAKWAMTQNNLGAALRKQGGLAQGEVRLAFLARAVEAYRAALAVYTEAATPADWARTQNNLAIALQRQGEHTADEAGLGLLAQAEDAYRAALTVHTEDAMPAQWALTQNNLGAVLQVRGQRTGAGAGLALLRQAIEAYRAALTVRSEEAMPAFWAMTMENVGLCHERIADRTLSPLGELRAAEEALVGALRVYTPQHMGRYHDKATASLARIRTKIAALER